MKKLQKDIASPLTEEQGNLVKKWITESTNERLVKRMEFYTNLFDEICKKRQETNGKQADMQARMANFSYFNAGMPEFGKKEMLEPEASPKTPKKFTPPDADEPWLAAPLEESAAK